MLNFDRLVGLVNAVCFGFQVYCKLIYIAFLEKLTYQLKLWLVSVFCLLFLLVDYQSVSIFKGVFSSPLEVASYFRPLLESVIVFDKFKQFEIFVKLPWPLFQMRTQIACPVFSALLGISINFVLILVEPIKFLGNLFPVFNLFLRSKMIVNSWSDYSRQQFWLVLGPIVSGKCNFFDAKPFEHASFRSGSWDKRRYEFPVFLRLNNDKFTISLSRS